MKLASAFCFSFPKEVFSGYWSILGPGCCCSKSQNCKRLTFSFVSLWESKREYNFLMSTEVFDLWSLADAWCFFSKTFKQMSSERSRKPLRKKKTSSLQQRSKVNKKRLASWNLQAEKKGGQYADAFWRCEDGCFERNWRSQPWLEHACLVFSRWIWAWQKTTTDLFCKTYFQLPWSEEESSEQKEREEDKRVAHIGPHVFFFFWKIFAFSHKDQRALKFLSIFEPSRYENFGFQRFATPKPAKKSRVKQKTVGFWWKPEVFQTAVPKYGFNQCGKVRPGFAEQTIWNLIVVKIFRV